MSTADSQNRCPQCNFRGAMCSYDARSWYEDMMCPLCGYYYCAYPEIDEEKSELLNDGHEYYKLTDDDRIIMCQEENTGYGAFGIATRVGQNYGVFDKPMSQSEIDEVVSDFVEAGADPEKSYVVVWDDERKEEQIVFGKLPDWIIKGKSS